MAGGRAANRTLAAGRQLSEHGKLLVYSRAGATVSYLDAAFSPGLNELLALPAQVQSGVVEAVKKGRATAKSVVDDAYTRFAAAFLSEWAKLWDALSTSDLLSTKGKSMYEWLAAHPTDNGIEWREEGGKLSVEVPEEELVALSDQLALYVPKFAELDVKARLKKAQEVLDWYLHNMQEKMRAVGESMGKLSPPRGIPMGSSPTEFYEKTMVTLAPLRDTLKEKEKELMEAIHRILTVPGVAENVFNELMILF